MPHGDAIRMTPCTSTDAHHPSHPPWLQDPGRQTLHPAHAVAHAGVQLVHPQPVEQPELRPHHILHGQDREACGVSRPVRVSGIHGSGTRAPIAASQHVGANDKVLVRVQGRARADEPLPPPWLCVLRCATGVTRGAEAGVQ